MILLTVLLMSGRGGGKDGFVQLDHSMELPVHDTVANSMYGGAQEIFQQPVAPPAAIAAPAVPPVPAAGLPEGWTMEQWQHFGAQYLRDNNIV